MLRQLFLYLNILINNLRCKLSFYLTIFSFFLISAYYSQCDYTVKCIDSWGDGWNGSTSLSVKIDGVEKGPINNSLFSTGSSFDFTLSDVPYGCTIEMVMTSSLGSPNYLEECEWFLEDPDGAMVTGSGGNQGNLVQRLVFGQNPGEIPQDPNWSCTVPGPPTAEFTVDDRSPCAGTTVTFSDASTGTAATSWSWDFGDGSAPSTDQNPTHTYATAGEYDVTFTATNSHGSDVESKSSYVIVPNPSGTFYVSTSGNDNNNGTSPITPFATLAKALQVVHCGSGSATINVQAG